MAPLPFTRDEFFDLFVRYNTLLWPAAAALWAVSALVSAWLLSGRRLAGNWIGGLLALHWIWSAVAYHIAFFTRINPAAWLFAAMFLAQAALFLWHGVVRGDLSICMRRTAWS